MNRKVTLTGMHGVDYCERHRDQLLPYVRSLRLLTDCDHVVFTDGLPRWMRDELWAAGAELVETPSAGDHGEYVGPETVTRWIGERNAWAEASNYDTYVCQGCKGSYFQADIPHVAGLHLTCEGMRFCESVWNTAEAYKWDPCWARTADNEDVINGGCVVADREDFLRYCRLEAELQFVARGCTNQPAVNWLVRMGWLPCTLHHPLTSDLCLTGEPCRLGVIKAEKVGKGGTYVMPNYKPYKMIRQAYRIPQ